MSRSTHHPFTLDCFSTKFLHMIILPSTFFCLVGKTYECVFEAPLSSLSSYQLCKLIRADILRQVRAYHPFAPFHTYMSYCSSLCGRTCLFGCFEKPETFNAEPSPFGESNIDSTEGGCDECLEIHTFFYYMLYYCEISLKCLKMAALICATSLHSSFRLLLVF